MFWGGETGKIIFTQSLNDVVVIREEAVESEGVSSVLIAVALCGGYQCSVAPWVPLSSIRVAPVGQQGGDTHHLCPWVGLPDTVAVLPG